MSADDTASDVKVCKGCGARLPAHPAFFHRDPACDLGFKSRCRACVSASRNGRHITAALLWAEYRSPPGNRVCRRCLQSKPETKEFYYAHKNSRGGLMSECAVCYGARSRPVDAQAPNADPGVAKRCRRCGESKPATTDYFFAQKRGAHGVASKCKPCVMAEKDRAASLAYAKIWYRERAEQIQSARRDRALREPEKHRAMKAAHTRNRRARISGNGGSHSPDDVAAQLQSQNNRCWWCNKKLDKKFEVDHRIPVSRGGPNDPSNLVVSCWPCNRSKGKRMPWEMDAPRLL